VTGTDVKPITMTDIKRRKVVPESTRADYTPQAAAPLDPNAVTELRFKLLNATQAVTFQPFTH